MTVTGRDLTVPDAFLACTCSFTELPFDAAEEQVADQIPDSSVVPPYFGSCVRTNVVRTSLSKSVTSPTAIFWDAPPFVGLKMRACTLNPFAERVTFSPLLGFMIATIGARLPGVPSPTPM